MDVHSIAFVIFIAFLAVVVFRDRKKFTREFILILRKTQRGKRNIIRLGRGFPRFWKGLGSIGVVFGFLMSVWIFYQLLMITARNVMAGGAPGLSLILPSPTAEAVVLPGVIGVPFIYFIIPLAILVIVHEGLHGVMAAMERVRIKSLGWGVLVVLPLAFVEPDEAQLARKPAMSQLRVFAAGSFANFITAGAAVLVSYFCIMGLLVPAGIGFSAYPAAAIAPGDITAVGGVATGSANQTLSILEGLDRNATISLEAGEETYWSRPWLLLRQENKSEWAVYQDLPAARAGLNGFIYRIENWSISEVWDLEEALDSVGPNRSITIWARNATGNQTFTLTTVGEPVPVFQPGPHDWVMAGLEQAVPGVTDFEEFVYKGFGALFGIPPREDWKSLQREKGFWEWAEQAYPALGPRAEAKLAQIEEGLARHPRGGFIGILGVANHNDVRAGLEPMEDVIYFFGGMLYWIFLINLGVGAFNLLPIRILDGGRMWEILLSRVSRKRHKAVMRAVSMFTTLIILLAILMIVGSFLG